MPLVAETETDAGRGQCSPLRNREATLLQNALLKTDGTVTDLLELFTDEEIVVEKIAPGLYTAECQRSACGDDPGSVVRDVILRGKVTGARYIFAHSHLFPSALPPAVQTRLSTTSDPIGKVLREYRTESFRQIQQSASDPMPTIARLLDQARTDQMRWRRYSVISGGAAIMEITEVFSEQLFASAS
jgi:chorismate--pyruvate lyase